MKNIISTITKKLSGKNAYFVGGWLRDMLLGRKNTDIDIAIPANAQKTAKKLAKLLNGTFFVLDSENEVYRIALKNSEIDYIDICKYKGKTILEDLQKRDFTINAIAAPIVLNKTDVKKNIYDPLNAKLDLKNKLIKQVSKQVFKDDPVRLMRAFRISCELGFNIEKTTLKNIVANAKLLKTTAAERSREELLKIFSVKNSLETLEQLDKTGLLCQLFPCQLPMKKSSKKFYFHKNGLWDHSVKTLKSLENILSTIEKHFPDNNALIKQHLNSEIAGGIKRYQLLKIAALFHDCAKPMCAKKVGGKMHFLGHETKGSTLIGQTLTNLKFPKKCITYVQELVLHHMRPISLGQSTILTERAKQRIHKALGTNLPDLLILALCDCMSYKNLNIKVSVKFEVIENLVRKIIKYYFQEQNKPVLPKLLDGHFLMQKLKIKPGPAVGILLTYIKELQQRGKITTKEEALSTAKEKLKIKRIQKLLVK